MTEMERLRVMVDEITACTDLAPVGSQVRRRFKSLKNPALRLSAVAPLQRAPPSKPECTEL